MLSKEEEKGINTKMDNLADEYMKINIPKATVEQFENLAIAFTYKQSVNLIKLSENLVKHSKRLTCWTIVIAIFTIVLGASTIWSIVDKYLL